MGAAFDLRVSCKKVRQVVSRGRAGRLRVIEQVRNSWLQLSAGGSDAPLRPDPAERARCAVVTEHHISVLHGEEAHAMRP